MDRRRIAAEKPKALYEAKKKAGHPKPPTHPLFFHRQTRKRSTYAEKVAVVGARGVGPRGDGHALAVGRRGRELGNDPAVVGGVIIHRGVAWTIGGKRKEMKKETV